MQAHAAAGDPEAARNAQFASDALLGDYQLTAMIRVGSGWIRRIQPLQTRREFLAWTGSENVARVWARSDGRPVTPPLTHPQMWRAGYTAHEDRLLTWGEDMRVRLWRDGRLSRTIEVEKASPGMTVRGATVSPDGRFLLTVVGDTSINSSSLSLPFGMIRSGAGAVRTPCSEHFQQARFSRRVTCTRYCAGTTRSASD